MEFFNRRLEYFIKASKYSSLSEASHHMGLSQSALSMALSSLETDLNKTLFDRSKEGIRLTLFGRQLVEKLEAKKRNLIHEVHELKESKPPQYPLKIGAVSHFSYRYLAPEIQKLKNRLPKIQLLLGRSINIVELIKENKLDFGFISWTRRPSEIKHQFIKKDPVAIVGLKKKFQHIERITNFDELKKEPWIHTPKPQYDWFHQIDDFESGYISTSGFDDLKNMVLGGYCIAEAQTDMFSKKERAQLSFSPATPPHHKVAIYAVYSKKLQGETKVAFDLLTKTLKTKDSS